MRVRSGALFVLGQRPLHMFLYQLGRVFASCFERFEYRYARRGITQANRQVAQPALVAGTA